MLGGLLEATNERPWLWVLFIIVIILPFVLIAAFCFPGGKVSGNSRVRVCYMQYLVTLVQASKLNIIMIHGMTQNYNEEILLYIIVMLVFGVQS